MDCVSSSIINEIHRYKKSFHIWVQILDSIMIQPELGVFKQVFLLFLVPSSPDKPSSSLAVYNFGYHVRLQGQ